MSETDATGEACESSTIEMNLSTAKYVLYTCPECGGAFTHPCKGSTSYGEEFEYCPYCEAHLRAGFYEVTE